MGFERVELKNYRNYQNLNLPLHKRLNLFLGDNGQGKTNILESLYLCSFGQSFRAGGVKALLNSQGLPHEKAYVRTVVNTRENFSLDKIEINFDGIKKSVLLNQKKISASQLVSLVPVILFSPESLAAIKSGPDTRRQLIDETTLNLRPQLAKLYRDHSHALKVRNKLLKQMRELPLDPSLLQVFEDITQQYIQLAAAVTIARLETIEAINPKINATSREFFGSPSVDIVVDYLISDKTAKGSSYGDICNTLYQRANQLKSAEINSGSSLVGPHKHDIRFIFGGYDSRTHCSQGQQRTLILAFKVAQVSLFEEIHRKLPVLLLDDVLSELDRERRENLVSYLNSSLAQTVLTTTDLAFCRGLSANEAQIFNILNGEVREGAERV